MSQLSRLKKLKKGGSISGGNTGNNTGKNPSPCAPLSRRISHRSPRCRSCEQLASEASGTSTASCQEGHSKRSESSTITPLRDRSESVLASNRLFLFPQQPTRFVRF